MPPRTPNAAFGPGDLVTQKGSGWIGQILLRKLWHMAPVYFTGWPDKHGVDQPFPLRYCCTWFASLPKDILPQKARVTMGYAPAGRIFVPDGERPSQNWWVCYIQAPVQTIELDADIRRPTGPEADWFGAEVRPVLEASKKYSTESIEKQLENFAVQHVLGAGSHDSEGEPF